jgi:hypothetical protein
MRVFCDRIPVDEVPDRVWRKGELFTRLAAVNLSSDGKAVEPLYIPLLRWQVRAGQVFIEINSSRPLFYITLQRRAPYLSIFRFPWELDDP